MKPHPIPGPQQRDCLNKQPAEAGCAAPTCSASELPKSDEMVVIGMSTQPDYWQCVSASVDSIAREITKIPANQSYAKIEMLAALKSLVGIMERASMPMISIPQNANEHATTPAPRRTEPNP